MIIYDCEIKKAILGRGEDPIQDIEYCGGWRDVENMGISVIGAYDYTTDKYSIFMDDNLNEFQELVDQAHSIAGFNSLAFDNKLCEANGINIQSKKHYDLLVEIWRGAKLRDSFEYPSHLGYGLDACAEKNLNAKKTGWGGLAPVDYQRGNFGGLINYNLNDVYLTKRLIDIAVRDGFIQNPKFSGRIKVQPPAYLKDKT